MLTDLFELIEKGKTRISQRGGELDTGVSFLPKLPRDAGDRNRTSPFAFTGNKFEFRAVSSGQSIAYPNIALNVAVTDALDEIATDLEAAVQGGATAEDAAWKLLPKVIKQHKRIIFNGNNYSEEWQKEAKKRGLLNLRNTVDALPELSSKPVVAAFTKHKVLNERELKARAEINYEAYNKTINVEAQLMVLIANRYLLPAALAYTRDVGQAVAAAKAGGVPMRDGKTLLATMVKLTDKLKATSAALAKALEHNGHDAHVHAKYFRDKVIPLMATLRETGDALELNIPHELWPLPTYREMLFIK